MTRHDEIDPLSPASPPQGADRPDLTVPATHTAHDPAPGPQELNQPGAREGAGSTPDAAAPPLAGPDADSSTEDAARPDRPEPHERDAVHSRSRRKRLLAQGGLGGVVTTTSLCCPAPDCGSRWIVHHKRSGRLRCRRCGYEFRRPGAGGVDWEFGDGTRPGDKPGGPGGEGAPS